MPEALVGLGGVRTITRLADLPGDHPAYVPGVGEVTVGVIRANKPLPIYHPEEEATLAMWRFIARHPHARAWLGSGDHSGEAERFRNHVRGCASPALREDLGL